MANKFTQESAEDRFARYQRARDDGVNWRSYLESIYNLVLANRNTFFTRTPGEARNLDIFDTTASTAIPIFASNLQSMIMPIARNWMRLKPGPHIKDTDKDEVQRQLDEITKKFFFYINRSNMPLELATSLQDMAISTGVMLLNEGTDENPLMFHAVPLSRVAFAERVDGILDNFWRDFKISVENIKRQWPHAKLPQNLVTLLSTDPSEKVEIIEGTIHYPENPPDKRYYVYVQDKSSREDLFGEWRSYSPWIAFRFEKSPDDTFGRGPAEMVFPTIKELNQFVEFMLVSAKFNAYPAFMSMQSDIMNQYSTIIQPGAIIGVDASFGAVDPIRPIKTANNLEFSIEFIRQKQQIIKEALFADPLGAPETPNQSATEISVRQQNWVRKSSSSFGRLLTELVMPLVGKSLHILRKKMLISDIKTSDGIIPIIIDDEHIAVEFLTPLTDVQNQDDLAKLDQYMTRLNGTFGGAGLLGIDVEEVVEYWADKLNIPKSLIPPPGELQSKIQNLTQAAAAQQGQGQEGGQAAQGGQLPQIPGAAPQGAPGQQQPNFQPIGS